VANDSSALAALQEELEKQHADRAQLQAEILRGDLVERPIVAKVFGGIFAIWRRQVVDLDAIQGDTITAILGMPESNVHGVRAAISDCAYEAVGKIVDGLEKFIRGKL